MKLFIPIIYCIISFFAIPHASAQLKPAGGLERTWTNIKGTKIEGVVNSYDGKFVSMKTPRGTFRLPVDQLSKDDQIFLQQNATPIMLEAPEESASKNGIYLRVDSRKGSKGSYKVTSGNSTVRNNATLRQVYTEIYLVAPLGTDFSSVMLRSDAGKEFKDNIPEFPKGELEKLLPELNAAHQKLKALEPNGAALTAEQEAALKKIVDLLDRNTKIGRSMDWTPNIKDESPYGSELGESFSMLAYNAKKVLDGDLTDVKDVIRYLGEIFPKFPEALKQGESWKLELLDHSYVGSESIKGNVVLLENGTPVQKLNLDIKGSNERFSK